MSGPCGHTASLRPRPLQTWSGSPRELRWAAYGPSRHRRGGRHRVLRVDPHDSGAARSARTGVVDPDRRQAARARGGARTTSLSARGLRILSRSEEHTSELQSLAYLVCRLLLEKKKKKKTTH